MPPHTNVLDWDIIRGYKQPPSIQVLLIPEEGRSMAVMAPVRDLQHLAPLSISILRDTGARLPLETSISLSHANTQTLVHMCRPNYQITDARSVEVSGVIWQAGPMQIQMV